MSKIQDALNKAMKSNSREMPLSGSTKRELVSSSLNSSSELEVKSNSSEIILMNDENLYDNDKLSELGVIYSSINNRKLANSYRDIRTKIIQKNRGENCIVMVTSCYSGHDSCDFTLNLATTFTFDESKTSLLIDTNLHNTILGKKLNLDNEIGLTDYLIDTDIEIESIVLPTGIKRLRMIPVGLQNETVSEYFTSLKMRGLMSDLLSRYSDRYIFINSSPVKDSADTRILLELCDYVILTVPYGSSSLSGIKDAIDSIGSDKILGVVFNEVPNIGISLSGSTSNRCKRS